MTLAEAVKKLREDVDSFENHWQQEAARGEDYPDELPNYAEWFEQFQAFMLMQED